MALGYVRQLVTRYDRYNRSPKGRARRARYEASPARQLRYWLGRPPMAFCRDIAGVGLSRPER